MNVTLTQDSYTVSEADGFVEVCIVLEGETEVNVETALLSIPGSADGVCVCVCAACVHACVRRFHCLLWFILHTILVQTYIPKMYNMLIMWLKI